MNNAMRVKIQNSFNNLSHDVTSYKKKESQPSNQDKNNNNNDKININLNRNHH